jgi:hypothetical protein
MKTQMMTWIFERCAAVEVLLCICLCDDETMCMRAGLVRLLQLVVLTCSS